MIICAAIKIKDTDIVVCGHRHSDCYYTFHKLNPTLLAEARRAGTTVEGFITSKGKFLDRIEAYAHANICGQISAANMEYKIERRENVLYSEDLY